MGWKTGVSEFKSRQCQEFSLLHVVQTGSGVHSPSYPITTGGSFPRGEAEHSPLANAEDKKMWIYISTPTYAFMA
jgi:hypothetical protein